MTAVAQHPYAIGYISFASVRDNVRALSINGVLPSQKTIKNGSYAIKRPFLLVTKKDTKLSEPAQVFLITWHLKRLNPLFLMLEQYQQTNE